MNQTAKTRKPEDEEEGEEEGEGEGEGAKEEGWNIPSVKGNSNEGLLNLFLYALNFLSGTPILFLEVPVYDRIFFKDLVATRD